VNREPLGGMKLHINIAQLQREIERPWVISGKPGARRHARFCFRKMICAARICQKTLPRSRLVFA